MCEALLEAEESCQLVILQVLREKGHLARYSQNSLFGKNEKCFSIFFTHTIYTLITYKIEMSHFQRENPCKTLES